MPGPTCYATTYSTLPHLPDLTSADHTLPCPSCKSKPVPTWPFLPRPSQPSPPRLCLTSPASVRQAYPNRPPQGMPRQPDRILPTKPDIAGRSKPVPTTLHHSCRTVPGYTAEVPAQPAASQLAIPYPAMPLNAGPATPNYASHRHELPVLACQIHRRLGFLSLRMGTRAANRFTLHR
jgi:hypothetical protein